MEKSITETVSLFRKSPDEAPVANGSFFQQSKFAQEAIFTPTDHCTEEILKDVNHALSSRYEHYIKFLRPGESGTYVFQMLASQGLE